MMDLDFTSSSDLTDGTDSNAWPEMKSVKQLWNYLQFTYVYKKRQLFEIENVLIKFLSRLQINQILLVEIIYCLSCMHAVYILNFSIAIHPENDKI